MSKPLTQLRFEDVYESFRVASPASLFQQQESGPAHPTIDISGRRCLESFERLAPPTSWRRTFAASLVGMKGWFSTRCALTWKVKATKSFRSYFLLQASTRRTAATESGLLLTPTTREEPVDLEKFKARMEKYPNGTTMPNLATQVQQMLPTPRAVEFVETPENFAKRNGDRTTNSMPNLSSMAQHVPQMLPTPVAWDGNGGGARKPKDGKANALGYSLTLKDRAAAQMLPTPMAQESDKITGKENQDSLTKRARQETGKTSQLSPLFVEEMMGFPKGWTVSPFQSGEESQ